MDTKSTPATGAQGDDLADRLDRRARRAVAALGGLSPASVATSCLDWGMHLAMSPGRQLQLAASGAGKLLKLVGYAARSLTDKDAPPAAEAPAHDRRFSDESWRKFPYNVASQAFLLTREWFGEATTSIEGVNKRSEALVRFLAHQMLDAVSPYNFPLTNPQVLERTVRERGANLAKGLRNLLQDARRKSNGGRPAGTEEFRVGETVACTKGKVIYRNRLAELIQYAPATGKVLKQPMLIVPPWIMKYYILDLSPGNSLIKYLVEQGHTVFTISWKNPDSGDCDIDLNDYLELGIMDCLKAVNAVVPGQKVNGVGYCAGGTLLAIAAAAMARDGDDRWNTISTFTAQTDCTEPGEINVFLNDSQLALIKEMMNEAGYFDGEYFTRAFSAMNANMLVWQPLIERYVLGEERKLIDLMAWNTDVTRVPAKAHYTWLKEIFLDNSLAEDRYSVGEAPVHLSDIRVPMCFVATTKDHIAPWQSVYKIHRLAPNSEVTFILTDGGHNAGIACGAEHPRREHQIDTRERGKGYEQPLRWAQRVPITAGSWWPSWHRWIKSRSTSGATPPSMGKVRKYPPLEDAPGTYVHLL